MKKGHVSHLSEVTAGGVVAAIEGRAGQLPQVSLAYEPEHKLLWITMRPEPKPVLTLSLIESIRNVQLAVWSLWERQPDRPILFMAVRSRGRVYSLGGDLDFYLDCLARNDRAGLSHYARVASDVILMSRNGLNGSVITLSNVHARVMGGGIDSARGCNVMVAEEEATFTYPEVNYNHFPISAVPILSRHAGPIQAEKILLSGQDYTAAEFHDRGVIDALVPKGTGEDWIRRYTVGTQGTHAARVAVMAAFNAQAGDLATALDTAASAWVSHLLNLHPLEISKLQRIAAAQERMLGRLLRPVQGGAGA
ncbi:crotonase/enoyl-CoA hydratase family protein [Enterovirga sp.]|uniref:crotonase/enoyl-CoA hydratase family protein n=1 Tax=Enterovirga sp. TaxID=2026350 RepID=UPI002615A98E|nr:crotonase/enoyl-CoA hydratase family protein [Enterovirga sp.]